MTKKVLVAERLADAGLAVLRDKGYEVDVKLKMPPEELIAAIPAYDALIVRSATKVTREVIEAGTNLRIIGRTWRPPPSAASSCATPPRRTS